jgi:hypothetical protein
MLIVCRNAEQIRDRTLFRAWLFKIARNALCRHYGKQKWEVETMDLADVTDRLVAASHKRAATVAFEFLHWMAFWDSQEREVMDTALHRAVGIPRDCLRSGHPGSPELLTACAEARVAFSSPAHAGIPPHWRCWA